MAIAEDIFGLVGTQLEGRFAVESVVARGGFGVIYRGTHLTLRKPIAVKVLFVPKDQGRETQQAFLDAFAQEAQTVAGLDHPAIVRVLDFGVSRRPLGGAHAPWMVLEWIEGTTLEQFIASRGADAAMSPREALALLRPVFEALAVAHDAKVAHRDVKPANIMLMPPSGGGRGRELIPGVGGVKLLDFGVAKVMEGDESVGTGETFTRSSLLTFSLPYASPEQLSGTKSGPWTDVHALGLILTQLLTGREPFSGATRSEVELQVIGVARPTPIRFGVDVGPWENVITVALARRQPDRFQHARDFLDALERAMPAPDASSSTAPVIAETSPTIEPDTSAVSRPTPRAAPSDEPDDETTREAPRSKAAPTVDAAPPDDETTREAPRSKPAPTVDATPPDDETTRMDPPAPRVVAVAPVAAAPRAAASAPPSTRPEVRRDPMLVTLVAALALLLLCAAFGAMFLLRDGG